jgi:hypothetical protein
MTQNKAIQQKSLENGGRKPIVWEDCVEIGEKHRLQPDHYGSVDYIP